MKRLSFSGVCAAQSPQHTVVSFAATASEILAMAAIDRVARDDQGQLNGFQRPQIASHIREIKDYLAKPDAILPNPIVLAFTKGIEVIPLEGDFCRAEIDISNGPAGFVVDGQQRLSALAGLPDKAFKAFVSAVICKTDGELRRQFVLINNTRPLPKSLIYELLPGVENLPDRLESRSTAAELTDRLNQSASSSLRGQIKQHTNPAGLISDTSIQRIFMNSLSDGIMRDWLVSEAGKMRCVALVSEFFKAVKSVFPEAWYEHTPKTSRLVHGAGVGAMSSVMEVLATLDGARNWDEFARGLGCLVGRTAWTAGEWDFGGGDRRHWQAIQNVSRDITILAQYLVGIVRKDLRARRAGPITELPLLADALAS